VNLGRSDNLSEYELAAAVARLFHELYAAVLGAKRQDFNRDRARVEAFNAFIESAVPSLWLDRHIHIGQAVDAVYGAFSDVDEEVQNQLT
jgi:hypothetical protein